MINGKTYYQILGVTPDAEDVVIRAAFKALTQIYHPDKFISSADRAHLKMVEINTAYEILSSEEKRRIYDQEIEKNGKARELLELDLEKDYSDYFSNDDESWTTALEYFPAVETYFYALKKINNSLAFSYREIILSTKTFEKAESLYWKLKTEFLSRYFGENIKIRELAASYIDLGVKEAVREINKTVRVLGDSIDADILEVKLKEKYNVPQSETRLNELKQLKINLDKNKSITAAKKALTLLGYRIHEQRMLSLGSFEISLDGFTLGIVSLKEMLSFAQKKLREEINREALREIKKL